MKARDNYQDIIIEIDANCGKIRYVEVMGIKVSMNKILEMMNQNLG